ncbi:MAG: TetR/AcrR family transcriptional regulator [Microcella sp.]|uniref:TetR/AcrR family transcriptional regulator n=1 Tax=Microcella sp. TaxID=1913979 RepID=UPI002725F90A|nr:TetR/AcrR family transcriptional regulator [Microcella sp.]MDO8338920.1 TetR/AcrR family transcriptional regulator [Microcella sp.]
MAERKSSEERREQIIGATLRLVARKGFASVTLRDVAAEVGIVHGLIRHYFASRDELVAAAFDHAVTAELASDEAMLAGLDPVAALAAWFATTPEDHYLVWIDAWSEAPRNAALAAAVARHHRDCERILADVIRRAVAAGAASSLDVDADSRMLTALADGMAVQHHAMGIVDARAADEVVFGAVEARLAIAPGTLAAADRAPARGQWLS